jgi:uncharacterized protein YegL
MTEEYAKAKILPFYLVVDVSWSMSLDGKIDSANTIVGELTTALANNPVIADKVRFSVIDFSDDAQVVMPLCDLSMEPEPPPFTVRGGTSFVAAFHKLRSQIEQDVSQLKADGFDVHRPAAFFISDGEPTDTEDAWRKAFDELTTFDRASKTGFAFFPNMIPFGVGTSMDTLKHLIHPKDKSKAYYMKEGAQAGPALAQMAEVLVASTLLSGASVGKGGPAFMLPDDGDLSDDVLATDYDLL